MSKVAGIKKCEKLRGIRISRIINMKIKITSDKKFMRCSSSMRDECLKFNDKLRERNGFNSRRRWTIDVEDCKFGFR